MKDTFAGHSKICGVLHDQAILLLSLEKFDIKNVEKL
jgi:hypothetical protein